MKVALWSGRLCMSGGREYLGNLCTFLSILLWTKTTLKEVFKKIIGAYILCFSSSIFLVIYYLYHQGVQTRVEMTHLPARSRVRNVPTSRQGHAWWWCLWRPLPSSCLNLSWLEKKREKPVHSSGWAVLVLLMQRREHSNCKFLCVKATQERRREVPEQGKLKLHQWRCFGLINHLPGNSWEPSTLWGAPQTLWWLFHSPLRMAVVSPFYRWGSWGSQKGNDVCDVNLM